MNKLKISALMLSVFMVACSSDDEIVNNEEKSIDVISAEIVQPGEIDGTRVIIGGNPGDATRPMTWRADDPATKNNEADVIYVFDSKGGAARFAYSAATDNTKGIFKRLSGNIVDIKNALCVPSSVGLPKQLPASVDAQFSYMNTMMCHRGAENAPMYGNLENNILKFRPATGMIELIIEDFEAVKEANIKKSDNKKYNQLGIKFEAFDMAGNPVMIASTKAHLDVTKGNLVFDKGGATKEFINYMVNDLNNFGPSDNRFYIPLITGEYGKFVITVVPFNISNTKEPALGSITVTPKSGVITIDKKLYTISKKVLAQK